MPEPKRTVPTKITTIISGISATVTLIAAVVAAVYGILQYNESRNQGTEAHKSFEKTDQALKNAERLHDLEPLRRNCYLIRRDMRLMETAKDPEAFKDFWVLERTVGIEKELPKKVKSIMDDLARGCLNSKERFLSHEGDNILKPDADAIDAACLDATKE